MQWLISAVNGGNNVYTIEKIVIDPPKGLREGYLGKDEDKEEDDNKELRETVVIFGRPEEWRITNAGVGHDVYL
jgi:hypothetical protein